MNGGWWGIKRVTAPEKMVRIRTLAFFVPDTSGKGDIRGVARKGIASPRKYSQFSLRFPSFFSG
jgi:hypothetical protein